MKYTEKNYLGQACAFEQDEPVEVPIFMVGEQSLSSWDADHSNYGYNQVRIYPAYSTEFEGRCFLITENWCSGSGYCASGVHGQAGGVSKTVRLCGQIWRRRVPGLLARSNRRASQGFCRADAQNGRDHDYYATREFCIH